MICLILDRSGSMQGRASDVVGGVNRFIEEQKALPDPACLALVRFDSDGIERFRPMTALAEVPPLRADEYVPRSMTPLLDAVGRTIAQLDDDWKRERPDKAIVVIVTDGLENASREYTREKVKRMIEARQLSGLWSFVYLGANVDAFGEAASIGVAAANTAGWTSSSAGTATAYAAASAGVKYMRSHNVQFADNLGKADLGEDPNAVLNTTGATAAVPNIMLTGNVGGAAPINVPTNLMPPPGGSVTGTTSTSGDPWVVPT